MDTGIHKLPAVSDTAEDKYTASIELSNACRQFYKSRVEAAHCIKSRWEKQAHQSRCNNDNDRLADNNSNSNCDNRPHRRPQRSSIDEAMDKLRAEMTSLMDQDLSLMKQLLTLNETIEDLKWQRRYYCSPRSSTHLADSNDSLSDTDMYESEDDLPFLKTVTSSSALCSKLGGSSHKAEKRLGSDSQTVMGESSVKVYHSEQDSFDSGIHESSSSSGEEEFVLEVSV